VEKKTQPGSPGLPIRREKACRFREWGREGDPVKIVKMAFLREIFTLLKEVAL
jgi:hypothetical protein